MKSCWAQYLLCWVVAVLVAGSMLSACGQKGSLVQPAVSAGSADSVEHKERVIKKP